MPLIELLLSDSVLIVVLAAVAGAASMLLYMRTSPQHRLKELEGEAAAARLALAEHDGDFEAAWPLIRRSFGLALSRVRIALAPSLISGLPVLAVVYVLEDKLSSATVLPWGPGWLQSRLDRPVRRDRRRGAGVQDRTPNQIAEADRSRGREQRFHTNVRRLSGLGRQALV